MVLAWRLQIYLYHVHTEIVAVVPTCNHQLCNPNALRSYANPNGFEMVKITNTNVSISDLEWLWIS